MYLQCKCCAVHIVGIIDCVQAVVFGVIYYKKRSNPPAFARTHSPKSTPRKRRRGAPNIWLDMESVAEPAIENENNNNSNNV
jgi:hypothetical protein